MKKEYTHQSVEKAMSKIVLRNIDRLPWELIGAQMSQNYRVLTVHPVLHIFNAAEEYFGVLNLSLSKHQQTPDACA